MANSKPSASSASSLRLKDKWQKNRIFVSRGKWCRVRCVVFSPIAQKEDVSSLLRTLQYREKKMLKKKLHLPRFPTLKKDGAAFAPKKGQTDRWSSTDSEKPFLLPTFSGFWGFSSLFARSSHPNKNPLSSALFPLLHVAKWSFCDRLGHHLKGGRMEGTFSHGE